MKQDTPSERTLPLSTIASISCQMSEMQTSRATLRDSSIANGKWII